MLLFAAFWVITLTSNPFELFGMGFSGRDVILILGGLFLVYKAVTEIHEKLEGAESHSTGRIKPVTFGAVIMQIIVLDMVFSFDSVITAVGMVDNLPVLIGVFLIADGFDAKIDKALNLAQKRRVEKQSGEAVEPVHLRHAYSKADGHDAIAAATSRGPETGAVGLSLRPVSGKVTDTDGHQEPTGLG